MYWKAPPPPHTHLLNAFYQKYGHVSPQQFQIEGSEDPDVKLGDYEVVSIESRSDMDRKKSGLSLSLSPSRIPPQNIQTPNGPEDESGKLSFSHYS